jgi:hypothetical protein
MIPAFTSDGNLPEGQYPASWSEVMERFGTTEHRRRLLSGLKRALKSLRSAGCRLVFLDGSFVTDKQVPGDFDGCWDVTNVDASKLDPTLLRFENRRAAQKAKFFGELFPAHLHAGGGRTFLEFFQQDSTSGKAKGIIVLDLGATDYD